MRLMGGADYGGGMWDLLASGPRAQHQRHAIVEAMAPIWEANHVLADFGHCFAIYSISKRIFDDNDCATYSDHRHVDRHRAARLGVLYFGNTIRPKMAVSAALEHDLWNREFSLPLFFQGLTLGRVDHGAIHFVGDRVTTGFFAGLAYAVCF